MADLWWTKSARRALEAYLKSTLDTAGVAMVFPGLGGDESAQQRYVRFSNHAAPVTVREMGNTPRIEGRGFMKAGIFTKPVDGQDANDALVGIVAQAFPYNMRLTRDGINVDIGTVDHGDFVISGGWGYSPVDVNWLVLRI